MEKLLTLDQLIDYLPDEYKLKKSTIYIYASLNKIPHIKIGRKLYFEPNKIDTWNEWRTKEVV